MKRKHFTAIIAIIIIIFGASLLSSGFQGTERIDIVGSTSVQPAAEKLAEEYGNINPHVKINVQGGGSSVGIKTANMGIADIGMSSRHLEESERDGLKEYEIGRDGIVLATNINNNVSDLTKDKLKDIYSGKILNLKEVGGKDSPINVVIREAGSGTLNAFEHIVMDGEDIRSDGIVQSSTEAVKQSVKQDENAIGFVSFAHMSSDVNTLKIKGVAPESESIADGSYELQRPFIFIVNENATEEVEKFIDWTKGREAQGILESEKVIKSSN